jgi:hypothetical protein
MIKRIDSIILTNKEGQSLMIYKMENSSSYCIGLEGEGLNSKAMNVMKLLSH